MSAAPSIDATLLGEAADWLVLMHSGDATEQDRQSIEQWRRQTPQHDAAWQHAETVLGAFSRVPANLGRATLRGLDRGDRRRALRSLAVLLVAAPTAWVAWRHLPWDIWTADYHTAIGEQRTIDLADGTRLVLNTASAVRLAYTEQERRMVLEAGEVMLTTGKVSPHRSFIVQSPQGEVMALGTRFSVRRDGDQTRVAVFEDAVELRPAHGAQSIIIHAGEQTIMHSHNVLIAQPVNAAASSWTQGMVLAEDMRLVDLVAELGRYRPGVLRCHPDIAGLRVSGAFPTDTDASLRLLEKSLPLRVSSVSRYWVSLEPR